MRNGDWVFPEIPAALTDLKNGNDWLDKSLDATEQSQFGPSQAYLRKARAASNRATKVLRRAKRGGLSPSDLLRNGSAAAEKPSKL